MGQERKTTASVSTCLAYFLNSEGKVRCENHLQNVGSLLDNLIVLYKSEDYKTERQAKT